MLYTKQFNMNGEAKDTVVPRKCGNSQGEINSEGDIDTTNYDNLQNVLNYVSSESIAGYEKDILDSARLTCCCKYHGHRVSDRTITARYKCRSDILNISVKQLTDPPNASTESINLSYSNKSESSESPHPGPDHVCYSGDSSRDRRCRRRPNFRCNRRTMLKLLFYSVLVCILCLCGGVVMMHYNHDNPTHKDHVYKQMKSGIYNRHRGTHQDSHVLMNSPIVIDCTPDTAEKVVGDDTPHTGVHLRPKRLFATSDSEGSSPENLETTILWEAEDKLRQARRQLKKVEKELKKLKEILEEQ